jgi:hypothetical protein
MAMRQSSGQAVPYNPLEWTSARGASPQAGAAVQLAGASPQAYSDGKSVITAQESYITAHDSVCSVLSLDLLQTALVLCEWENYSKHNAGTK